MRKKRNQANQLAIFFLLFFGLCGGLLIYRSQTNIEDLITYEGILETADTSRGFGNLNRNYAILMDFKGLQTTFGIYAGTADQAIETLRNLDIVQGEYYKIYVDKSVGSDETGINLGIRKIESQDQNIYHENMTSHITFGFIFILLGLISSTTVYLLAKKRFK